MGSDRHGGSVDSANSIEERIKAKFAAFGPQLSSEEFQHKAGDVLMAALKDEMSANRIPPAMANGLMQYMALALAKR